MYQRIANGKVISVKDGNMPYIYVGTDVGKPTPGVGDLAICTDTGKQYICFVNGIWAINYSVTKNGASNHEGTITNVFGQYLAGAGTGVTNAAFHRYDMTTGTGVAGSESDYIAYIDITPLTDSFEANILVQNLVSGANGNRYYFIGIMGLNCEVVFTQTNAGAWQCHTHDGVTDQTTNIANIVAGDRLAIKGTGGKIHYLVNGSVVASHTTVALVGVTGQLTAEVVGDVNVTTARELSVDQMSIEVLS